MSNHVWIQENLDAYLAGGLSAEERERFEKHIGGCPSCARALTAARQMEHAIGELFADARPDQGLEQRMIQEFRKPTPHRAAWPLWMRFASGVAAALLFGVVGASTFYFFDADGPRNQSVNRLQAIKGLFFAGEKPHPAAVVAMLDDTRSMATSDGSNGVRLWAENDGRSVNYSAQTLTPEGRKGALAMAKQDPADHWGLSIHNHHTLGAEKSSAQVDGLALELRKRTVERLPPGDGDNDRAPDGAKPGPALGYYNLPQSHAGTSPQVHVMVPVQGGVPMAPVRVIAMPPQAGMQPQSFMPQSFHPQSFTQPQTALGGDVNTLNQPAGGSVVKKPELIPNGQTPERKIIRTGEMEFEIEKYDDAAATIAKLTDGVKGAYIETDDSTRQANNKKRGVIVVRVPPDDLNKFVAGLRSELAKMGELKSQRLGSKDVSKQYIDTDGNLKVAKAMEQRFLDIIKGGKGDIKDLIAAENALGEWRTKIERMVGELRYYDKQIALGTITVTLFEKDIQAPASLVVTEKIGMRIEVEEVEKAHVAALAAIAEVKGRVTKSELKQFAQGHVKAFVNVEVTPVLSGPLGDKLKKLGIVTHHDATRLQETKGGSGRSPELKPSVSDVMFEIELYNAANIQPREAVKMLIATLDVPGNYRKLQEAVGRVKGQVRDGKLNEIDKLKIFATFDFDILASDRPAIDKLIAEVGPLVSRSTDQAPANELSTERRIGYRLVLRSVAGILPREKSELTIEVANVEAKAAELKGLVGAAQGIVSNSNLQHEPNGIVKWKLVFEVPKTANHVLIGNIKKSGTVRSQFAEQEPTVPDNELATARITVTLTNAGPIVPPDEGMGIRTGLYISFKFFSWCIIFVITGVLVVLPCVIAVMFIVKMMMWMWRKMAVKAAA